MPKRASSPAPARVTVRSVAERAGVSIGAVSSVLNNHHEKRRIAAETVERVRQAVAELGYLPNISARRLRGGHQAQNTIVLAIITSFQAPLPVIHHFILALREASAEGGEGLSPAPISVTVEMFDAGRLRDLPGLLEGTHFNAAIITNTTPEDDRFLEEARLPYPTVLVNRSVPGYPGVIEDPEAGARAVEVLVDAGRRRLAVLAGQPRTQITRARVDAFLRAAAARPGVTVQEIRAEGLNVEAADAAMNAFFARSRDLDGLFAVTDGLALGSYRAAKQAGLVVPRDLAVVGVGDFEISPYFDPPLTTVGVSYHLLAQAAARALLRQLGRGRKGTARIKTVPVTVKARASTR